MVDRRTAVAAGALVVVGLGLGTALLSQKASGATKAASLIFTASPTSVHVNSDISLSVQVLDEMGNPVISARPDLVENGSVVSYFDPTDQLGNSHLTVSFKAAGSYRLIAQVQGMNGMVKSGTVTVTVTAVTAPPPGPGPTPRTLASISINASATSVVAGGALEISGSFTASDGTPWTTGTAYLFANGSRAGSVVVNNDGTYFFNFNSPASAGTDTYFVSDNSNGT